jgi:hypothetical protein
MLRPSLFNAFSTKQKTETLQQQGKFLYTRHEPAYVVDSYEVACFYVEIYYPKLEKSPAIFRSFYEGDTLAPFIPEDKIHYLYQDIVRRHTA